jgi:hypothetical protein
VTFANRHRKRTNKFGADQFVAALDDLNLLSQPKVYDNGRGLTGMRPDIA